MTSSRQYLRNIEVIVGTGGKGLSISMLRICAEIHKDHQSAPNHALIKIYNLNDDHQAQIKDEFTDIIVNGGYQGSEAVIFRGNIKHVYRYRDGNDHITEIDAGDGDRDFRGAIVNATLAAGTSDHDIVDRAVSGMTTTKKGNTDGIKATRRLRGKVISGNARDVLDDMSRQHGANWSIQDGHLQIVPANGVLPNEAIVVSSETGMLGAPEQDDKGIRVTTLMNPQFQINSRIKLNNNDIKKRHAKLQNPDQQPTQNRNEPPARLDPDGIYKLYKIIMKLDNRGSDWSSEVFCVAMDSAFPTKGVSPQ